jgi:hypothetical protein
MEIPDSKAAEIRLLEWRPALSVYGEAYLTLVKETVEFIKRSDANTRTLKYFWPALVQEFFQKPGYNQKYPISTAPFPGSACYRRRSWSGRLNFLNSGKAGRTIHYGIFLFPGSVGE